MSVTVTLTRIAAAACVHGMLVALRREGEKGRIASVQDRLLVGMEAGRRAANQNPARSRFASLVFPPLS